MEKRLGSIYKHIKKTHLRRSTDSCFTTQTDHRFLLHDSEGFKADLFPFYFSMIYMICMICMIWLLLPGGIRRVCMIYSSTCFLGWI